MRSSLQDAVSQLEQWKSEDAFIEVAFVGRAGKCFFLGLVKEISLEQVSFYYANDPACVFSIGLTGARSGLNEQRSYALLGRARSRSVFIILPGGGQCSLLELSRRTEG